MLQEERQETATTLTSTRRDCIPTIDIHKLTKEYPLRKLHYLWLSLHAIIHPYYISQRFALYFLFVQTTAGCDFKHDIAMMYIISIFCETLVIPLTGYICDRFKRFNHIILIGTFLFNFICSIVLYILFITKKTNSQTLLIAINIAQTLVSMQYNNSLYKLTKLYINHDTLSTDWSTDTQGNHNNIQTSYFTRIGIWSRFTKQFVIALMVVPAFIIMRDRYLSFNYVQYILLLFVIVFGFITMCLSLRIAFIFQRNPHIYYGRSKSIEMSTITPAFEPMEVGKKSGYKSWYFCRSFKLLCTDNKITRYGIVNVILVFLLSDLLDSYEPLTIAGVDMNRDNVFLDNFCANFLTNLMYQSCWSCFFTAIGALLYMYVLLPLVDTFTFYRYVYPISSLLVGVAVFAISGVDGNINQTWLSMSLGFLLAFFGYARQFDDYLNLGYMNEEAVGFYQIVYAWSNNVWRIFGYLFLYLNVLNIAVAVIIVILWLASVIQSLFFFEIICITQRTQRGRFAKHYAAIIVMAVYFYITCVTLRVCDISFNSDRFFVFRNIHDTLLSPIRWIVLIRVVYIMSIHLCVLYRFYA
eukprot:696805_1